MFCKYLTGTIDPVAMATDSHCLTHVSKQFKWMNSFFTCRNERDNFGHEPLHCISMN